MRLAPIASAVPALLALALAFAGPAQAAKLTAAEIEAKLRPIPMFVLTDGDGAPLVANDSFGVFTDKSEADAFLRVLQAQKPDLGTKVVVTAIPLSEIVRLTGPGSALRPEFVGPKSERDAAEALRAKDSDDIGDAPLFLVRAGEAYLTVSREGRSLIPVFFSKKQADEVVARYAHDKDGAAARVDVASLESILNALLNADDPDVARISLVPSESMMAAIARPDPAAPKPPATPAASAASPRPR
jgi:hypothetical protein